MCRLHRRNYQNIDGAKTQYLQIINSGPNSYVVTAAKMGLARCLQASGQSKEARQLYEEILALGQNSPWFTQAYLQWVVLTRDMPPEKPSVPAMPSTASPAKNGAQLPFPTSTSPNFTTLQPQGPAHNQATQYQSCTICHASIHGSNTSSIFFNSTE